jgi:hypothetical protein
MPDLDDANDPLALPSAEDSASAWEAAPRAIRPIGRLAGQNAIGFALTHGAEEQHGGNAPFEAIVSSSSASESADQLERRLLGTVADDDDTPEDELPPTLPPGFLRAGASSIRGEQGNRISADTGDRPRDAIDAQLPVPADRRSAPLATERSRDDDPPQRTPRLGHGYSARPFDGQHPHPGEAETRHLTRESDKLEVWLLHVLAHGAPATGEAEKLELWLQSLDLAATVEQQRRGP